MSILYNPIDWTSQLTLYTNIVHGFLGGNFNICTKIGRLVLINMTFTTWGLAANTYYVLGTIPVEYRPRANTIVYVTSNSNFYVYVGFIRASDGGINFKVSANPGNNAEISIFTVYYI